MLDIMGSTKQMIMQRLLLEVINSLRIYFRGLQQHTTVLCTDKSIKYNKY